MENLNQEMEFDRDDHVVQSKKPDFVPPLRLPLNDSAFDSPVIPKHNRQKCGMILHDALKRSSNPPSHEDSAAPLAGEVDPPEEYTGSQQSNHEVP